MTRRRFAVVVVLTADRIDETLRRRTRGLRRVGRVLAYVTAEVLAAEEEIAFDDDEAGRIRVE